MPKTKRHPTAKLKLKPCRESFDPAVPPRGLKRKPGPLMRTVTFRVPVEPKLTVAKRMQVGRGGAFTEFEKLPVKAQVELITNWLGHARDALAEARRLMREVKEATRDNLGGRAPGLVPVLERDSGAVRILLSPLESVEEAQRHIGYAGGLLNLRMDGPDPVVVRPTPAPRDESYATPDAPNATAPVLPAAPPPAHRTRTPARARAVQRRPRGGYESLVRPR